MKPVEQTPDLESKEGTILYSLSLSIINGPFTIHGFGNYVGCQDTPSMMINITIRVKYPFLCDFIDFVRQVSVSRIIYRLALKLWPKTQVSCIGNTL